MGEWITVKIKDTADFRDPNSFIDGDRIESSFISSEGIFFIQTGNIGLWKYVDKNIKKYVSEDDFKGLKCKDVKPWDVLICRLWEPIWRSCLVPDILERSVTSVDVIIYRAWEEFDQKFMLYIQNWDSTLDAVNELSWWSTRQRISRRNYWNLEINIPKSITEQKKIATILSTIDRAIDSTQALIDKHENIKEGMMHDLFTRGIDITTGKLRPHSSDAPELYKESELGLVPKEWEVKELWKICTLTSSKRIYAAEYAESWIPFWRWKEVIELSKWKNISTEIWITKIRYLSLKRQYGVPDIGDILISSVWTLGAIFRIENNIKFYFKDWNLIWLRDRNNNWESEFIELFMPTYLRMQFDQVTIWTSQKAFTIKSLNWLKIFSVNKEEREDIVDMLQWITDMINVFKSKRQKLLLQKKWLMKDLLSGKVRVSV